jgi:hypothetical protein
LFGEHFGTITSGADLGVHKFASISSIWLVEADVFSKDHSSPWSLFYQSKNWPISKPLNFGIAISPAASVRGKSMFALYRTFVKIRFGFY